MWEEGVRCFGQAEIEEGSILEMIEQWEEKPFQNAILRRLWDLLPGFIVWNTWKERNNQVFERKTQPPQEIWKRIQAQIIETLGLTIWSPVHLKASLVEAHILTKWGIGNIPEYARPTQVNTRLRNNVEVWEPPPQHMFKLNFDGAPKGNLGLARLGGVFRNAVGESLGVYWDFIGENTNNVTELKSLLEGINMVVTNGWFLVIIEGDSQVILQMAMKLLHGKSVNRVVDN
jgi:hypothetical protein